MFSNRIISTLVKTFPTASDIPVTGFESTDYPRMTRTEAERQIEILTELPYFGDKGRPTNAERQRNRDKANKEREKTASNHGYSTRSKNKSILGKRSNHDD